MEKKKNQKTLPYIGLHVIMKTVEVYYMMIDVLYMACVLTKIRKTTLNIQSQRDLED